MFMKEMQPPEKCPQCGVVQLTSLTNRKRARLAWAAEHVVGVAQGVDEEILQRTSEHNFERRMFRSRYVSCYGKCCSSVRVILKSDFTGRKQLTKKQSMLLSLQNFSAKLSQTATKKNLEMRVDAECGATAGKMALAKRAKELGLGRNP